MKRIIMIFVLVFSSFSIFCQIPRTISWQGILQDSQGNLLNGNRDISISLYDVATGGNQLWSEFLAGVPINNGLVTLVLGEVNPLNLPFDKQYWIEFKIDQGSPLNRIKLTSVPYALSSSSGGSIIKNDSLILKDASGVTRIVLNPNTGTFKMMNNDTTWYEINVLSPPKVNKRKTKEGMIIEEGTNPDGSQYKRTYDPFTKNVDVELTENKSVKNPDGSYTFMRVITENSYREDKLVFSTENVTYSNGDYLSKNTKTIYDENQNPKSQTIETLDQNREKTIFEFAIDENAKFRKISQEEHTLLKQKKTMFDKDEKPISMIEIETGYTDNYSKETRATRQYTVDINDNFVLTSEKIEVYNKTTKEWETINNFHSKNMSKDKYIKNSKIRSEQSVIFNDDGITKNSKIYDVDEQERLDVNDIINRYAKKTTITGYGQHTIFQQDNNQFVFSNSKADYSLLISKGWGFSKEHSGASFGLLDNNDNTFTGFTLDKSPYSNGTIFSFATDETKFSGKTIFSGDVVVNAGNFTDLSDTRVQGDLQVYGKITGGSLSINGTKNFCIDHPDYPNTKYLMHASIESDEVLNQYSGNAITDNSGIVVVQLPSYVQRINTDFRYQLTVIGQFSQAIISREISDNSFEIKTDKPNVKVSWLITARRNDKYIQEHPFKPVVNK